MLNLIACIFSNHNLEILRPLKGSRRKNSGLQFATIGLFNRNFCITKIVILSSPRLPRPLFVGGVCGSRLKYL